MSGSTYLSNETKLSRVRRIVGNCERRRIEISFPFKTILNSVTHFGTTGNKAKGVVKGARLGKPATERE